MKTSLFALLGRYATVGVLNTVLHWSVFFLLVAAFGMVTSWANLLAFIVAVTFSFFMNARFTFNANATGKRYFLFVIFMALLSFGIGKLTDDVSWPPLVALIGFSLLSLVLGFLYSRFIVFADK